MKKLYFIAALMLASTAGFAQVVISQAYGGGGNTGATYTHDFVELFNRGSEPVSLAGYSIQYASATGTSWVNKTDLPAFTLQPGQYFLVQQAQGNAGTDPLPAPDLITVAGTGPTDPGNQIAMAGSNFKLVLANSTTVITSVTDPQVVDLLGVGTANAFEGTVSPAVSNTTSAQRNNGGCVDTNNNAADFTIAAPAPRNSSTPFNVCSLRTNQNSISGLSVYPNPVVNGNLFVTSESEATKAVTIFDVLGKVVLKTTVNGQPINVSALNSGVYIVKITEEGKTATRKLVIK
jgi:hypothetical protein